MTLKRNPDGVKRKYRSDRRRAQAEATRHAILDAAHHLFLTNGYAATPIRAIAEAAGVSDQTVYNVFGDKPTLLLEVGNRVVSGETPPDAEPGRDFEAELRGASDPRERAAIGAAWSRHVWESGMLEFESMLLDAGTTDPRAAEVGEAAWKNKYESNQALFAVVFPEDSLPAGIDHDKAYDFFSALNSAAFVRILIHDRGWSWDTYERSLATALQRLFTRIPS